MKDKVCLRCINLNKSSYFSIEVFELNHGCVFPWFIHWFKSNKSTVSSISLKKQFRLLKTPLDICKINMGISFSCFIVARAHPFCVLIWPMRKVIICSSVPNYLPSSSTIIKSILWIFLAMNIKKNSNSILGTIIEHLLNIICSSVHASNIWSIRSYCPISNWKSNSLNAFLR